MTEAALISAEGLSLSLEGQEVLSHVDIAVSPGELVSIIGPNGAGKTTLLRVLLSLVEPDEGQISRKTGLVVSYVPQRFPVDPVMPMTVGRFLDLPRADPAKDKQRVLEEMKVGHLGNAQLPNLSGGEFQRVLLARAMLRSPDLLVLDEPAQQVDFAGQVELYELIASLRDRYGCGIIVVSHDLHLVMAATDRVVCLNHHVCCHGTPENIQGHPEYIHLVGKRAAEAVAVYTHYHDHRHDLTGDVVPAGDGGEDSHPRGSQAGGKP